MDFKSFEEKELSILREAVDEANILSGKKLAQSEEVTNIINILEHFLRVNKTMCYGGTAINNILPEQYKFYNRNVEIPDYDFFSPHALEDAKELCNLFKKENIFHVEGKNAVSSQLLTTGHSLPWKSLPRLRNHLMACCS